MPYRYAILGAGRQGVAAAYDLLRFGDAREVVLADADEARARDAVATLERLGAVGRASARAVDAASEASVRGALAGADAAMSAVPYFLNVGVTRAAIAAGASLCDLGGNTDVVRSQHALDADARAAGVRVVPDCGLAPGLNQTLAAYAIGLLPETREVRMFCGGLPQEPRGPLGYSLLFSIHGLVNEYLGRATVLRGGEIAEVEAFTEPEAVDTPIGPLEAFVTSGGTSTAPWTWRGRLDRYDYKTLRYPGHFERVRAMIDLGLLDAAPARVGAAEVSPRALFCAVAGPRLDCGRVRDVVVLKVVARGRKAGRDAEVAIDLVDRFDESTGFSAMERTTGFSAAIVCAMLARGEAPVGVNPIETAIDPHACVTEIRRRGFDLRVGWP